ncbi:MAG: bifunctional UDP-sugar hydrolase/5'-nucleotidase [candidate division WOR-3 bacterium]
MNNFKQFKPKPNKSSISHNRNLVIKLSLFIFFFIRSLSAQYQHLYIIHTNDIHGALLPSEAFWLNQDFPPPLGNAASAVTLINELREQAKKNGFPYLLLDAGDIFKGTPIGDFTKGEAIVDYFNYMKYDAIAVGNHDFDFGISTLKEIIEKSNMPWLCSNLINEETKMTPDFFKPYVIFERGGLRIGVFGLISHYLTGMVSADILKGFTILKHYDAVRQVISEMREKGVDIIIGLTHIGYSHDQRLADSVFGIDVIIGGHSHTGVEPPFETPRYHTIIQQAYSKLTTVGLLDLTIDMRTKKIAGYDGELFDLQAEAVLMNKEFANRVKHWQAIAEKDFDQIIGYSKKELTRAGMVECPVGNLITDALREHFNADIAVHNSGGIRANIPAGEITYRDIYKVDIFGNTAVTMNLTGKQVLEMLEVSVNGHHAIFQVSGLKMTYDKTKPIGSRVLSVMIGDKPLDTTRTYKIVTNSYLAAGFGEYGVFQKGEDIEDSYLPLRDIIVEYIKKHSPVDAKVEGRIVSVNP